MKKILLILALSVGMLSCSNSNEDEEVSKTKVVTPIKTALPHSNIKSYTYETKHEFSTPGKTDVFRITLTGNKISEADVVFRIISAAGKEIYNVKFKGRDLIGYGLVEKWGNGVKPTDKEFEAYILKRLKEFFQEKNFSKPAIAAGARYDMAYSDKKIWDEIKADKTSVGFHYLIGSEDGRWIAFSKKQNKVVMYMNCC
jgi:hypothetical protein